jgi:leucokinin receptor
MEGTTANTTSALNNSYPWLNATDADSLYDVTPGIVALLSLLYGSISLVTVLGNLLVILVIFKNQSMRTVTNFYIANLSFADVVIGVLGIPFQFQAALLQRWDLPHFLCPVAPFVKELTVNVSIMTLAVISIDRYRAVIHPLKPRCSKRVAHVVMAVVWFFSLLVALPAAVVFRVMWIEDGVNGMKPFCYPAFPQLNNVDLGRTYRLVLVIIQYFFPLLIICFAYIRIIHKIWLTKAPGSAVDARDQIMNRNKRKVGAEVGWARKGWWWDGQELGWAGKGGVICRGWECPRRKFICLRCDS